MWGMDLTHLLQDSDQYENGNERSSFIKCWTFFGETSRSISRYTDW
jgi:hypothetical protein